MTALRFVAMYLLPALWIAMSLAAIRFTVPLILLLDKMFRASKATGGATVLPYEARIRLRNAASARRGAMIPLFVQMTFVLFGISGFGWFPLVASRIAFTVLIFADNLALGYMSYAEYRDLRRSLGDALADGELP